MGDTQTEPLIVLGIEIELATGPEVNVYEDIRFARLTKVVPWMKAISATVGRMKSGLALQDFNSVEMDGPILLFGLLLFLFFDGHWSFAIVAGTLQQVILRAGSESELNRNG